MSINAPYDLMGLRVKPAMTKKFYYVYRNIIFLTKAKIQRTGGDSNFRPTLLSALRMGIYCGQLCSHLPQPLHLWGLVVSFRIAAVEDK
jgi:hypothetical protein